MIWLAALALSVLQALEVRVVTPFIVTSGESEAVPFLVVNAGAQEVQSPLAVTAEGCRIEEAADAVSLSPRGWRALIIRCRLDEKRDAGTVEVRCGTSVATARLVRGLDLSMLPWRRRFAEKGDAAEGLTSPELDDEQWPVLRVPSLFSEVRNAWCRVRVRIPADWRGRSLRVVMGAVDDNDVTYFNGREIGRTYGWDLRREYRIPEDAVRWGEDNVLTVMVENLAYGGGIYKAPVLLLAGEAEADRPAPRAEAVATRPPQGPIGRPLPLRPMHVRDGILRYPDGSEVALWGVNIYPQSWVQYTNAKRLGVDIKASLKTDLDHLQQMGVQVIRMHIFDREITNSRGEILDNEHLDILDYLVAECSRRGIYLFLTPIAWWGGPNENPDAFSARTSKPGMIFVPEALEAAERYLAAFLSRQNRYTGRAYKDEPALCVLEIMNEPAYLMFGDLGGEGYVPQGEPAEVLARDRRIFLEQWTAWLAENGLQENAAFFPLFRYHQLRAYLRRMVSAIRSTGAKQPVACSTIEANTDELIQAIADSECEAITFSLYPGGWEKVNDGHNLMHHCGPLEVDPRLAGKARLVYEFDTPATNTSCYLFPAEAARFRAGEVQIACQFQYDSIATARWNCDWGAHWLNWHYTPSKAVSFMIAGETFRSLPRGIRYEVGDWRAPRTELRLEPMFCSYAANNSIFTTPEAVLYARSPAALQGIEWPEQPKRIVGVGSSRYVDYSGTGAYVLERETADRWRLRVNPDARLVGNSLEGRLTHLVAELESRSNLFRLLLPGWDKAECRDARTGKLAERTRAGWVVYPGEYVITRRARPGSRN